MPKLYEYFVLIVLFYSNENYPIHVHGKYQARECKAEFIIVEGKIVEIKILPIKGKAHLSLKETKKFETLVEHFKEDIVKKWIDFFVMNKEIKPVTINRKLD